MGDTAKPYRRLQEPLDLPCGAVLKNRLVKSAMSDSLGDGRGDPTTAQARLYERWAEGGVALSIIGEVQVDPRFPEKPGNLVLHANSNQAGLRSLVDRTSIDGAHLWPQLGHAGALSHPPISRPKGPSALDIGDVHCAGMSTREVMDLPNLFANAAMRAKTAGFGGVQIHAGHGFLLSQFLSPLFNRRTDDYGGTIDARCRVIREVVDKVRQAVGTDFPIALKINATDSLEGGLTQDDALAAIRLLDRSTLDLIDISGGTYFPGAKATSDGASGGPYFLDFARRARDRTDIPLMLTGGFKTRDQASDAITSGAIDVVGIARALVLDPQLANTWFTDRGGDPEFPRFTSPPSGGMTAWFTMRLTALAEDREDTFALDLPSAIQDYEARDERRRETWQQTFALGPTDG